MAIFGGQWGQINRTERAIIAGQYLRKELYETKLSIESLITATKCLVLSFFYQNGEACGKPSADAVQLAVTSFFIT